MWSYTRNTAVGSKRCNLRNNKLTSLLCWLLKWCPITERTKFTSFIFSLSKSAQWYLTIQQEHLKELISNTPPSIYIFDLVPERE